MYEEFEAYKDKYKILGGIIEDLCKANDKVRMLEEEGKNLREHIAELEDATRPAKEDTEEEKVLSTCALSWWRS